MRDRDSLSCSARVWNGWYHRRPGSSSSEKALEQTVVIGPVQGLQLAHSDVSSSDQRD